MKIVGIICEYNPLHLGHAAQMEKIRAFWGEDAAIICVMSGNFVQRGAPAVLHKMTRANAAVACGADVVLELPVTGVLSSAERFASVGVEVLDRLGVADLLCFGSESGVAELFRKAAEIMEQPEFDARLHEKIATGLSYGAARQQTLSEFTGLSDIGRFPNDILALEYCRALRKRNSTIAAFDVRRPGSYHDTLPDPVNPSATAVRGLMTDDSWLNYVPIPAREIFRNAPQYGFVWGERAVLARLRGMSEQQWEQTAHGSEGLWRKVMKAVRTCGSFEEIAAASVSKRYPMTRIHRLLTCAYLGLTDEDLQKPIPYARVLAFSEKGRSILRRAKDVGDLPLVNAGQTPPNADFWAMEQRCSDLFSLFAEDFFHASAGAEKDLRVSFAEK